MTATHLESLITPGSGTRQSASPGAGMTASSVAPALVIIAVTALLLLSGCAVNPVNGRQSPGMTLNLGEATSWLAPTHTAADTSLAGR